MQQLWVIPWVQVFNDVISENLHYLVKMEAKKKKKINKMGKCMIYCLRHTCSLSSVSCPDRLATSLMVDSSFSCRFLISFCSPSESLLTSDIARIRGNQSRLCSCGRPSTLTADFWFTSVYIHFLWFHKSRKASYCLTVESINFNSCFQMNRLARFLLLQE